MPTYQYSCTSCGEDLEVFQSFTDPTLTVHEPGCGGPLRKVFGSVGVVFKGSGFYRTDSRKGDIAPGPSKSESKSESKSDSSTSTPAKTESAPAAKSESSAPKKSESKSGGSTAAA